MGNKGLIFWISSCFVRKANPAGILTSDLQTHKRKKNCMGRPLGTSVRIYQACLSFRSWSTLNTKTEHFIEREKEAIMLAKKEKQKSLKEWEKKYVVYQNLGVQIKEKKRKRRRREKWKINLKSAENEVNDSELRNVKFACRNVATVAIRYDNDEKVATHPENWRQKSYRSVHNGHLVYTCKYGCTEVVPLPWFVKRCHLDGFEG